MDRNARFDILKVRIEEVNTEATIPIAKGRDLQGFGIIDIDISAGEIPKQGQTWWIDRYKGTWQLNKQIRDTSSDPNEEVVGADRLATGDIQIGFTVREKKNALEYQGFVYFAKIQQDVNGNPEEPDMYVIEWIPCSRAGTVIPHEKARHMTWIPGDVAIDDPGDYALPDINNRYFAILPGEIERPKKWYWKARVRGSKKGVLGKWSKWSPHVRPSDTGLPLPPPPVIDLTFKVKEVKNDKEYQGIVTFRDIGWWDIPGYDEQDDVTEYHIQLEPIMPIYKSLLNHTWKIVDLPDDIQTRPKQGNAYHADIDDELGDPESNYWNYVYRRIDPKDYPRKRRTVKDKDEDKYPWSRVGRLIDNAPPTDPSGISEISDVMHVDETGWIWPSESPDGTDGPDGDFFVRMLNPNYDAADVVDPNNPPDPYVIPPEEGTTSTELSPQTKYEQIYVTSRTLATDSYAGPNVYIYEIIRAYYGTEETDNDWHFYDSMVEVYYPEHQYRVVFSNIPRPKVIWWRARGRSFDRFGRRGPWSEWTYPTLPFDEVYGELPAPSGVALDFDRIHHDHRKRWRCIVSWNEEKNIPINKSENASAAHYNVQLAPSDDSMLLSKMNNTGTQYSITAATWVQTGTEFDDGTLPGEATLTIGSHTMEIGDIFAVSEVTPVGYNMEGAEVIGTTATQITYSLTAPIGGLAAGSLFGIVQADIGTISVSTTYRLPALPFFIMIDDEIMEVTNAS